MVNNVGTTEIALSTTIGGITNVLQADITVISGELEQGFLLFGSNGAIGVITEFTDADDFVLKTYATSDVVKSAISTTATAKDLAKDKTAYVKSGRIKGTIQTLESGHQWPLSYYGYTKDVYSDEIAIIGTSSYQDLLFRAKSRMNVGMTSAQLATVVNRCIKNVYTRKY